MEIVAVSYEVTNNQYKAKQWLNNLPDLFAADFETANRLSSKEKAIFKYRLDNFKLDGETKRVLQQQLYATALAHPSLTTITHLSIAWSDRNSYVIILDTDTIRNLVLNFLTSTCRCQLWHNSTFDFKHIYHNTGKLPKNYIDTLLLSKCLLNDANPFRDKVGLKDLMGHLYGSWGLLKEEHNFTLENIWNTTFLNYTATDSCATFRLYNDILEFIINGELEK